jgi:hypothetical protein
MAGMLREIAVEHDVRCLAGCHSLTGSRLAPDRHLHGVSGPVAVARIAEKLPFRARKDRLRAAALRRIGQHISASGWVEGVRSGGIRDLNGEALRAAHGGIKTTCSSCFATVSQATLRGASSRAFERTMASPMIATVSRWRETRAARAPDKLRKPQRRSLLIPRGFSASCLRSPGSRNLSPGSDHRFDMAGLGLTMVRRISILAVSDSLRYPAASVLRVVD